MQTYFKVASHGHKAKMLNLLPDSLGKGSLQKSFVKPTQPFKGQSDWGSLDPGQLLCKPRLCSRRWEALDEHITWEQIPLHRTSLEPHLCPTKVHTAVAVQSCLTLCDPWTVTCQALLSFTISQSLLRFVSIESVMLSNNLILCSPLLLISSIFKTVYKVLWEILERLVMAETEEY